MVLQCVHKALMMMVDLDKVGSMVNMQLYLLCLISSRRSMSFLACSGSISSSSFLLQV